MKIGSHVVLRSSEQALSQAYDVALLDLDGVVYVGAAAVPGAADALYRARADGMRLAFVTNNAARPPSAVAQHLRELSIPAEPADVITSAQAAARYLARELPPGAPVLVVGTTGLIEALAERGLTPVRSVNEQPQAVVQGYSPTLDYQQLAEAAVALGRGVPWVATNLDLTVPSPRGPLPGNGSMVAALSAATSRRPVATGKPDPTMHRETMLRTHARHPLVVGDRLDTDIEGATAVGCDSLLVLSGVTTPALLLHAAPAHRPTYLARDVSGLNASHSAPKLTAGGASSNGWHVDPELRLSFSVEHHVAVPETDKSNQADNGDETRKSHRGETDEASAGDDRAAQDADLDALRVLCAVAWEQAGDHGRDQRDRGPSAGDAVAAATLQRLGFAS